MFRVPYLNQRPVNEEPEADLFDLAQPGDAILCRLNKPNVATCLGFLRRGKRARIEGRDLGKRLEFHVQRACDGYAFQELTSTMMDLDTYEQAEIGKMAAKNKSEAMMALFEDEVDAARLIMERCIESSPKASWPDFQRLIADLFGDDVSNKQTITLSSIHKAKGREWPRVFILGRTDYMPFHLAKMDWEIEQEYNLIYVGDTRAQHILIHVTGVQSALDKGLHREVRVRTTFHQDAGSLEQALDEVAEKHGIEEPPHLMPSPDFPFGPAGAPGFLSVNDLLNLHKKR